MTPTIRAALMAAAWAVVAATVPSGAAATTTHGSPPVLEQARDRRAPQPRRPAPPPPRVPSSRGSFVFIGGYFYDPFFGPYPWWPRPAYPYWYFPVFDSRAEVRIDCRERGAAVYVDGFYAGIVDDFDGIFQRLPLPPGGHRLTLYLEGFETADYSVYLRPGSSFTVHHDMMRLPPGEASRRPEVAPPVPPPPDGTYTSPTGMPPIAPPPGATPVSVAVGTLELLVQPGTATVAVDGARWVSSEPGSYDLQLPVGAHRIEVSAPGFRAFATTVDVRDGETTPLNVSLTRGPTR
ncbi:MAG: PEGA domain-containing protein [Vicinamibacterales bacterium]